MKTKNITFSRYSYGEAYDILKARFDAKHRKMKTNRVAGYLRLLQSLERNHPDEVMVLSTLTLLLDRISLQQAAWLYESYAL